MSAFVGTPSETGRPITAPLSSLERSVHAVSLPAPPRPHRTSVRRPVSTHQLGTPPRQATVTQHLVIVHTRPVPRPRRRLASTTRKAHPAAPSAPTPAQVAETQPPATPPAADDPEAGDNHGKGNGNAYGHEKDKDHGHGHEGHEQ